MRTLRFEISASFYQDQVFQYFKKFLEALVFSDEFILSKKQYLLISCLKHRFFGIL